MSRADLKKLGEGKAAIIVIGESIPAQATQGRAAGAPWFTTSATRPTAIADGTWSVTAP
jgi:hypothetical protein